MAIIGTISDWLLIDIPNDKTENECNQYFNHIVKWFNPVSLNLNYNKNLMK